MLGAFLVFVGNVQECLGRNAPHVQTGATEGFPLLDAAGLQAQLSGLDGCHVTYWGKGSEEIDKVR